MKRTNPLLPQAIAALDGAKANGLPATSMTLRALMDEDVDAQYSAMDIAVARRRLQNQAIRTVLKAHGPAFITASGYEHADASDDDLPVGTLERIVELRAGVVADATHGLEVWRDRLSQARLREGLEAGVSATTAPAAK